MPRLLRTPVVFTSATVMILMVPQFPCKPSFVTGVLDLRGNVSGVQLQELAFCLVLFARWFPHFCYMSLESSGLGGSSRVRRVS